ncbi:DUF2589 domain-containing protein [Govanella unica]|uniref:DUF2589 domain-containing protein n=1 Tax=Govanella unica TaxID=2975056 RepID=A0A9X3TXI7_9PROT|nr:DUF2589 domain-containing protein [Govania unica]MDA5193177.1 DUF2589 domain-containing protein [Govania unica]
MALDPSFTGSVINALPIDKMIGAPLNAMVAAQVGASKAYADFLQAVCIKDGKAVQIAFDYDETIVDEDGVYQGVLQKSMRVPLMAVIEHPNVCVELGTVDFELEVNASEMMKSETGAEASVEVSAGWGPVSFKMSGKVSHKSEQTRSSDTRAKYSIHAEMKRQPPSEALMRVIEFLTSAATKPVVIPANKELKSPDALPTDSVLQSPAEEQAELAGE